MAQAVMYIDSEKVCQRGLHAPKRATLDAWVKELRKVFQDKIDALGGLPSGTKFKMLNSSVTDTEIRILCEYGFSFHVDRLASWT